MTELTTYEQVGYVALISMDDGKANAFGPPMIAAVDAMLDRAADGEFRIGLNEVAIGATLPSFAWLLAKDRLSKRFLTQAALTAKIYHPEGARDAGFLDEVVAADKLRDVALEHATQLAELDANAYAGMKRGLRGDAIDAVLAGLEG